MEMKIDEVVGKKVVEKDIIKSRYYCDCCRNEITKDNKFPKDSTCTDIEFKFVCEMSKSSYGEWHYTHYMAVQHLCGECIIKMFEVLRKQGFNIMEYTIE